MKENIEDNVGCRNSAIICGGIISLLIVSLNSCQGFLPTRVHESKYKYTCNDWKKTVKDKQIIDGNPESCSDIHYLSRYSQSYMPKDLSMSLYMDLLKSSNDEIKKMLRDKRLAKFLIDAM